MEPGLAVLEDHINGLYGGRLVPEEEVRRICEKAKEILSKESNVVAVRAPITIVRLALAAPRGARGPRALIYPPPAR